MRGQDKDKSNFGKASRTITFDKVVLKRLEERSRLENKKVSELVNLAVKELIISDIEYYRMLAKEANREFHEYLYLQQRAETEKAKESR